jgi:FAD:protein FMN transferase
MKKTVTTRFIFLLIGLAMILGTRLYWSLQSNALQNEPHEPYSAPNLQNWQTRSWKSLYTQIHLTIQADSITTDSLVFALDTFYTRFTQTYRSNSPLDSLVYNTPKGTNIALTPEAYQLFFLADSFYTQSQGLIHPGIGNLIRAYGLQWGQTPAVPVKTILQQEVKYLSTPAYTLTAPSGNSPGYLTPLRNNLHFALGAFAKGYALQASSQILQHKLKNKFKHKQPAFMLEIGGDMAIQGTNPQDTFWTVGIRHPDYIDSIALTLTMHPSVPTSIATSGGYMQFFTDSNGTKHHHILNPLTGGSATGIKSATALHPNADYADFLATWFFIQPLDSTIAFIQNTPNTQAVIITQQDSIWISPGLQSYCK